MLVTLNSSSLCSKRHENILDQGFLLGPSDSAIFPSSVPPLPVSSPLKIVNNAVKRPFTDRFFFSCFLFADVKRMGEGCLWTNYRPAHNDGESEALPSLPEIPRSQPGSHSVLRPLSSSRQHVTLTELNVAVFPLAFFVSVIQGWVGGG